MTLPTGLATPPKVSLSNVLRIGVGLVVVIGLVAGIGISLRDPIVALSGSLVTEYGLIGLFVTLLVTDPMPGLGFQPAVFLAYTGGIPPWPLLGVAWVASMCASVFVYAVGRTLRGRPALVAFLMRWRVGHWLSDHGARTIALASMAPVPFVLVTFGAGVMGVKLTDLLLGASFRGFKIGFTLLAIMAGWGVSA
ncbi:MAG: hypothetical protein V4850_00960 [Myxococcota bacterium]